MKEFQGPPGWLERTFLYTFGLSGFIMLIHTGNVWVQGPQLVLVSAPRPWFGRPSRHTTERPRLQGASNVDMEEYSKLMAARVDRMRNVCSEVGDAISSPKRVGGEHTLMWDPQHHLVYCPIYKVASGTWTTNFLRLSSFNSDLPKWQRFSKSHDASESTARKMFPPPRGRKKQQKELARSAKFLVVRHPFDRIVSAYKGKISRTDAKPRFYRELQKEIKADYSRNPKAVKAGLPPTFEEYWRYLTDLTDGLVTPKDWRAVDCVQAFYSVCVPCDVEYNVILKLETHEDDTEFLVRKYGLTELQEPFTMWKHKSTGENQLGDYDYYLYDDPRRNPLPQFSKQGGKEKGEKQTENKDEEEEEEEGEGTDKDKARYKRSLFSQLTRNQVWGLYRNYKTDFDMFGYNITEFLEYAKEGGEENDDLGEEIKDEEEEDGHDDEEEKEQDDDEEDDSTEDEEEDETEEEDMRNDFTR